MKADSQVDTAWCFPQVQALEASQGTCGIGNHTPAERWYVPVHIPNPAQTKRQMDFSKTPLCEPAAGNGSCW